MCRNLSFLFYCLLCVVALLSRIAFLTVGPFLYVKYYNLSPITYSYVSGLVILACIGGLALQNFLSFRLVPRQILHIGGMLFGGGACLNILVQMIGKVPYMLFSLLTAVTMVGSGLLYPIGMGYGIAVFNRDSKTAAGMFTFIRTVLCTVGLMILAAFFADNPLSFGLFLFILALLGWLALFCVLKPRSTKACYFLPQSITATGMHNKGGGLIRVYNWYRNQLFPNFP